MTAQAMNPGTVDFLTKPVRDQTSLDALMAGIVINAVRRAEAAIAQHNVERFETLTPRERQVLHTVTRGRLNKQIAFDLGISELCVKLCRGDVMGKREEAPTGESIPRVGDVACTSARGRRRREGGLRPTYCGSTLGGHRARSGKG